MKFAGTTVVDVHAVGGERPAFDLYIGRAVKGTEFTEDSVWANHHRKDEPGCLEKYERDIRAKIARGECDLRELVGKRLGCWCKNVKQCHGGVLLRLLLEFGLEEGPLSRFFRRY